MGAGQDSARLQTMSSSDAGSQQAAKVDDGALPHAVRALIGRSTTRTYEVCARDIKRFAQAIAETDPIHSDHSRARALGYPGIVAPPLYYQSMTFEDVDPGQLPPDGSPIELELPLPAKRTVGGSSDYRVYRLVCAGERVTIVTTLQNVAVEQGRSGLLYLVEIRSDFSASDGERLATEIATYVKRV